ncbi:MAG: hypothetical protein ACE5ED_01355 [Rhodothalassiaceae bacterium]
MGALDLLNAVLALAFVLGLIGALAWLVRRAGLFPGVAAAMGRKGPRRLEIRETLGIDSRHRLILVARDGVEHLILIGPAGDRVVESDIAPGPPAGARAPESAP